MRACFYDTWAFLALANARNTGHDVAQAADQALERAGFISVTSDYILDETLTALHVHAGAHVALKFLSVFDAQVLAEEMVLLELTSLRRDRALREFRKLAPRIPRLSFTDCTSFTLMRELDIRVAFTADRHFLRAGPRLRPLLTLVEGELCFRLPEGG